LNPNDAKALPGRSLHHHPALQAIDNFCSQRFQADNLGRDIVGFNVDMDATLMLDALDLDDGFILRRLQHAVVSARSRVSEIDCTTQRIGPEPGGLIDIRCVAVNQKCAEAGVVHENLFWVRNSERRQLTFETSGGAKRAQRASTRPLD
jgi:hypothetical protein